MQQCGSLCVFISLGMSAVIGIQRQWLKSDARINMCFLSTCCFCLIGFWSCRLAFYTANSWYQAASTDNLRVRKRSPSVGVKVWLQVHLIPRILQSGSSSKHVAFGLTRGAPLKLTFAALPHDPQAGVCFLFLHFKFQFWWYSIFLLLLIISM